MGGYLRRRCSPPSFPSRKSLNCWLVPRSRRGGESRHEQHQPGRRGFFAAVFRIQIIVFLYLIVAPLCPCSVSWADPHPGVVLIVVTYDIGIHLDDERASSSSWI